MQTGSYFVIDRSLEEPNIMAGIVFYMEYIIIRLSEHLLKGMSDNGHRVHTRVTSKKS